MSKAFKGLLILTFLVFIIAGLTNKPANKPLESSGQTPKPIPKTNEVFSEPEETSRDAISNGIKAQKPSTTGEEKVAGEKSGQENMFLVAKVIDGDTISLDNGKVIRYIGIDTPETKHPSKSVQCFGAEASWKNKELIEGKLVRLEKDVSETDKYGRLLRYVWVDDLFVNEYLVRQGYAQVSTYPPDVKYQNLFLQAQQEAREGNRGLWAACYYFGEPITSEPTPAQAPTPAPLQSSGSWDCSGNVYNCSDFSTHAQAQAAFEACGGMGNDIHRLDADKDGLACESLP